MDRRGLKKNEDHKKIESEFIALSDATRCPCVTLTDPL